MTREPAGNMNKQESLSSIGPLRYQKIIGVYFIACRANGRLYIGSSSDVYQRMCGHIAKLRSGKHPHKVMLMDFTKHGESEFSFTIERSLASADLALEAERDLIAVHTKSGKLYNTKLLAREVVRKSPLGTELKAFLATQYSYRPILSLWSSLREFADDIGITPDHARVMKLRGSVPAKYWLAVEAAALVRGFTGV
jgi:predicted GIY-YIG superfamily endonuclease